MAELVLYTNPMSRGRIARWMLEETGQPYDTVLMEYGPPMKTAEYLAINPMGKVPSLIHGDRVVTENGAICAYLADIFPGAGLGPEPGERAAYYRWMFFAAGPVDQAMSNESLKVDTSDPMIAGRFGYGTMERVIDTVEAYLSEHDHATGARFTAADVMLGSVLGFGMRFGSIPARPAIAGYVERVTSRPAAMRAQEIDDALLQHKEGPDDV